MAHLQVILTVSTLSLHGGGPVQNVSLLKEYLDQDGINSKIVSSSSMEDDLQSLVLPNKCKDDIYFSGSNQDNLYAKLALSRYRRTLTELSSKSQSTILHDNGIWEPRHHASVHVAKTLEIPLVVSIRGMLQPWALKYKHLKKKLAWHLYQCNDLKAATVYHAASESEAESIRRLGLRQPVAIIPNGILMPSPVSDRDRYRSSIKTALYVGRIHPSKGLMLLIKAWSLIQPRGWQLVIAGPDQSNYTQELNTEIRRLGLADQITFIGPVEGTKKNEVFSTSDLFILPSYSENFGVVVAEALSYALPVITTHGAPWSALVDHECGWWVSPDANSIARALQDATYLPDSSLLAMGNNGRRYVHKFSMDTTGRQFMELYNWLLTQGERPSFVV